MGSGGLLCGSAYSISATIMPLAYPTTTLGDIAHIFVGVPTISRDESLDPSAANVLTVRCVGDSAFDPSGMIAVDFGERDVDRYRVKPDDVLLPSRSTALRACLVPPTVVDCVINATVIGIRPSQAIHPRILVAFLSGEAGAAAVQEVSQTGTVQMNNTVSGLSKIIIPLMPLVEQQQLVELLNANDIAYQTAIQAAECRRRLANEIVSQMLTGKTHSPIQS